MKRNWRFNTCLASFIIVGLFFGVALILAGFNIEFVLDKLNPQTQSPVESTQLSLSPSSPTPSSLPLSPSPPPSSPTSQAPSPTATPSSLPPSPIPPSPSPSPPPPSLPSGIEESEAPDYKIIQETTIGKYVYRIWKKEGDFTWIEGDNVGGYVTLSLLSEPSINLEEIWGFPVKVHLFSGKDITGEGNPDLILESYSGGAHCCFQHYLFDLGDEKLSTYLETQPSNCPGEFKDFENDASYEFVTCDDLFAYTYCSFARSPMAPVVLKFIPSMGYRPATPNYKNTNEIYTGITADIARAEESINQEFDQSDTWAVNDNILCPAIQVAIDYLYIGERETAEQEFRRLYDYPDVNVIWREINMMVSKSPLYTSVEFP